MDAKSYVLGIDFGTDSVRSLLVDARDGSCLGSKVHWYQRWKKESYCDAAGNQFRQHPLDHLEGLQATVRAVVAEAGIDAAQVKGLCVDTTGSSPMPVNEQGVSLAMTPGFEENPNAMVVLWKDHTAIREAEEINHLSRNWGGEDYTRYEGGIYSSEWFWAKILHVVRQDKQVAQAAYSWMEHCDWITHTLTGSRDLPGFRRSRCAAGHKAMWHPDWDGLPSKAFLQQLHPYLSDLRDRLYQQTYTSDEAAGRLSREWAERLGLSEEVVVAVGTFDAHAGAVGGEVEEHAMVKVMGTSTCDIMVASKASVENKLVRGICGQVEGSVIPGMVGLEAGQSGFGDVLAWFTQLLSWPVKKLLPSSALLDEELKEKLAAEMQERMMAELSAAAEAVPPAASAVVALDWVNGRRTPDANQALKGALMNLGMGTEAPHIFRALVEAICFGSKKIVDRFEEEGVSIKTVIGLGGVAKKSPFVMQTLADVLNMPIRVASAEQAPALGAAMYAAVAAGIHRDVSAAKKAMGSGFDKTYHPRPENSELYRQLYRQYTRLGQFVESETHTTHE